jgi:hypothetical protein
VNARDTGLRRVADEFRRAGEELRQHWGDTRADRFRGERLAPVLEALDQQLAASGAQQERIVAAEETSNLAGRHLERVRESLRDCDEETRLAGRAAERAEAAAGAGLGAADRCDEQCDLARRLLEEAAACGVRIPMSREAMAEVGMMLNRAVAVEAVKWRVGEVASQWLEEQLQINELELPEEITNTVDTAVRDAGAGIRVWWANRRRRR